MLLTLPFLAISILQCTKADELDDLAADNEQTILSAGSQSVSQLSNFSPLHISAPFLEQFADDSWSSRWTPSQASSGAEGQEEMNYVGRWAREEPHVLKGMAGDFGLVLKDDARRHAISAPFEQAIDNKDKTLIIQYEVKMQKGLECGGAYLKLLTVSPIGIQAQQFSGDTPYTIMFGPDKCGSTNKVHFIFRHRSPVTQEYREIHLSSPPVAKISKLSTLYALQVNPDQTFEIKINNKSVKKGSLLEDFTPAVNPEKLISDPNDSKPLEWVDEAKIEDPSASKPEDWDEDAPYEIEDPDATKPDGWLDNEPELIADPDAAKPEDWDDEEDGTWVAPKVPNPKCTDGPGCGEWARPTIKNPAYKGKWFAPKIDNPAYQGVWEAKKIDNPDFFEDKTPADFEPMSGIGFELWTMQGDILFDNILVSHNSEDAELLVKEWKKKFEVEEAEDLANAPKATDEARDMYAETSFASDPVKFVSDKLKNFISLAQLDPLLAAKSMPEVLGALIATLVTLSVILASALSMFGSSPKTTSTDAVKLKDKTAVTAESKEPEFTADGEAITSGTNHDSPVTAAAKTRSTSKKA